MADENRQDMVEIDQLHNHITEMLICFLPSENMTDGNGQDMVDIE